MDRWINKIIKFLKFFQRKIQDTSNLQRHCTSLCLCYGECTFFVFCKTNGLLQQSSQGELQLTTETQDYQDDSEDNSKRAYRFEFFFFFPFFL